MAAPSLLTGNYTFQNNVVIVGALTFPDGSVDDDAIEAGAGIDASKLVHQHPIAYRQAGIDESPAGDDTVLHIFRGSATMLAVQAVMETAPSGGDKQVSIDVKLGDEDTSYTTILSSALEITSSEADREVVSGTVSVSSAVAGDSLKIEITPSGSTGSYGTGLCVIVWVRENPD